MTKTMEVPTWIERYVRCWMGRLCLDQWHSRVRMEQVVNGDDSTVGLCSTTSDSNEAHIQFRSDIEDDEEGRIVVIHELLHVLEGRRDHFVEDVLLPQLHNPVAEDMASHQYKGHLEPVIDVLSRTLYALAQPIDYPETLGPPAPTYPDDAPPDLLQASVDLLTWLDACLESMGKDRPEVVRLRDAVAWERAHPVDTGT